MLVLCTLQDSPADGLPSEGEVMLPAQPLSEHIVTLGAAVAAQTADVQPHPKYPKQQFAASRHDIIERSLGELSNGQVQQLLQYNGADRQQDVGEVPLSGNVVMQRRTRPPLAQQTSADNGLSIGKCTSKQCFEKQDVVDRTLIYCLPG